MIIWKNISPAWETTAADDKHAPYEGTLSIQNVPPENLESRNMSAHDLASVVLVDGEMPEKAGELIGRIVRWDDHDWVITYAIINKNRMGTKALSYAIWISRPRPDKTLAINKPN